MNASLFSVQGIYNKTARVAVVVETDFEDPRSLQELLQQS
jgi:hypothetical protein